MKQTKLKCLLFPRIKSEVNAVYHINLQIKSIFQQKPHRAELVVRDRLKLGETPYMLTALGDLTSVSHENNF